MATTDLTLGAHWENFIGEQIAKGRYSSATEVVRAALREMEIREAELRVLRAHLEEGYRQAEAGEFVDDFSVEKLIEELDAELHEDSR